MLRRPGGYLDPLARPECGSAALGVNGPLLDHHLSGPVLLAVEDHEDAHLPPEEADRVWLDQDKLAGHVVRVLEAARSDAALAMVSLDLALLRAVRADRDQICAVVLELMTNAATAEEGRPRIRLEAEFDEVNEAVMLKVEDFGPGMDEETAGRVFTPFFSSQRAGRRRGMGLPRVKRIVESNGGRIWLKTRRGEGTTVYVLLPKA